MYRYPKQLFHITVWGEGPTGRVSVLEGVNHSNGRFKIKTYLHDEYVITMMCRKWANIFVLRVVIAADSENGCSLI